MELCVLGSGSKGNVTYLKIGSHEFLIDCGLSNRQIMTRLKQSNIELKNLKGIFITHEHSDHVNGLSITLNKTGATCYITPDTFESIHHKNSQNISLDQLYHITPYNDILIDDIRIHPLSVSHDAQDAVGYVFFHQGKKLVYITDIGYLPKKDFEILADADFYVFESNYDVTLLFTSNRPFYLKQRIDSIKGHMSNTDSAYNLAQLIGPKTKGIVLAHPSRECNTKDLAYNTLIGVFDEYGIDYSNIEIEVASQDIPTKIYHF
jgi:phosphoribosyl 1,2-cyclic phosphodiesterase